MKKSKTSTTFKVIFSSVMGVCILILILSSESFDLVETDIAMDWSMKYFALPIFIVMILCCSSFYVKFIRKDEPNVHKTKIMNQLRAIFTVLMLTLGSAAILIATTVSLILLTNAYMGDSRTIDIKATVVDYYTSENKGRMHHHIQIQDPQLDRLVKFDVEEPYKVGQEFNKTLQIGQWGLLYSK